MDVSYRRSKRDQEETPKGMEQVGSHFTRDLVGRYLKQAPMMYRVSKPPAVVDLTQDTPKES